MQNWNRRDLLRAFGLTSLVFGLPAQASAFHFKNENGKIRRLLYNENPHGPSRAVKGMIAEQLGRSNRYCTFHEYDHSALKKRIAEQEGLRAENVLLGHGSFEPLTWLAIHFGMGGGEIIVPSPTFDVVGLFGRKIGAKIAPVEVADDFKMNLPEMENRLSPQTKLLTVCNPNNPTGTHLAPEVLTRFCRSVSERCPVLVDEAYIQFLEGWRKHTMTPLIADGHNVLVARTFSKIYGMAGLRIGYLMGPSAIISELEKKFTLGFPGNMPNSLSVAAAMAALNDTAFVDASRKRNAEGRDELMAFFKKHDFKAIESSTNFVYFDVVDFPSFKAFMRKNDIVLAGGWPSKPNWGRVTIGTEEDMEFFTSKLKGREWL